MSPTDSLKNASCVDEQALGVRDAEQDPGQAGDVLDDPFEDGPGDEDGGRVDPAQSPAEFLELHSRAPCGGGPRWVRDRGRLYDTAFGRLLK